MRFAFSRFSKAIVIGVLGCAAAILVACGDSNGLLTGDRASSLDSALDGVQAACARGLTDDAQAAVAKVRREVDGLSADGVDRRLVRQLRAGADTIAELIPQSCETVTDTIETQTEVVPSPEQTTTSPPATTPTTPSTTPTTPSDGGGATTPPESDGGATTPDGGETPDTGGGGTPPSDTGDGSGEQPPDANQGNPGGALAPGQGGSTP